MKLSIFRSKWLLGLFLLVLVEPAYFRTISAAHSFYTVGKYLVLVAVCILILYNRKFSKDLIWVFSFYGSILFSTILGSGLVREYLGSIYSSLAMCLLFVLWLEKNPDTLLDAFSILEIYVYINLATILIYPEGMYNSGMYNESWFLGFKNPQIRTILPIVCVGLIRSYRHKGKISLSALLLVIAASMTMVLNGSSTGLVGIVIFILLLFIFHKKKNKLPRVFNLFTVTVITSGVFAGIIVFRIQEIFAFFIVGVLGKDLDFTNRAGIWNTAIELIKEKFLFGYGFLNEKDYISILNYRAATHPHNYLLYLAMNGGVVLLVIWLIGIIRASDKLDKTMSTVYSKIILFTLCSFLVMGLTESLVSTELLYPMLLLGMKADMISELPYQNEGLTIFGKRIVFCEGGKKCKRQA